MLAIAFVVWLAMSVVIGVILGKVIARADKREHTQDDDTMGDNDHE
jgi:uncharacterized membrane-anchored protein YhcB (DUF1043 family)